MDVAGKKAIVIFVPVPQIRAFQKIQVLLNIFVYYMYVTVLHYGKIKID